MDPFLYVSFCNPVTEATYQKIQPAIWWQRETLHLPPVLEDLFSPPQKSRKADLMTCTAVFKSRILLPNSPSSTLRAWTKPAGQIQQVNHSIFSKYFEKRKQEKNQKQNQTTNSDRPTKTLFKKKKLVCIFV